MVVFYDVTITLFKVQWAPFIVFAKTVRYALLRSQPNVCGLDSPLVWTRIV